MKYAIISDIHGNYMALQKILDDAKANKAEVYIFVGITVWVPHGSEM